MASFAVTPRPMRDLWNARRRDGIVQENRGSGTMLRVLVFLVSAALATLAATAFAHSQDAVESFFRGKSVNIYVGSSAGGGYDTYARLLARHFGKHIPGQPTIVVQNMPGAGSNKAASFLYNVAPKDGTAIGAIFPGAVLQPLLTDTAVQHEPNKFIYLGSANSDVYHCFARADSPAKSFRDVLQREVILGASNEGGTTRDLPAMMNNLAGAKFRIVTGYAGSKEIGLAVERNEVHGACGIGWTGFTTLYPHWFDKKLVTMLLQLSVKGHAELDAMKVPLATEFARTSEERQAMELVLSQGVFGRPFVLPPGLPPERAEALRKAFVAAMTDSALVADAKRANLDIEPISGTELQTLIASLYALPATTVEKAKKAMIYKAPQ
jgi:tripartite-type tricarboxylate transporter receptor subunit TctC